MGLLICLPPCDFTWVPKESSMNVYEKSNAITVKIEGLGWDFRSLKKGLKMFQEILGGNPGISWVGGVNPRYCPGFVSK